MKQEEEVPEKQDVLVDLSCQCSGPAGVDLYSKAVDPEDLTFVIRYFRRTFSLCSLRLLSYMNQVRGCDWEVHFRRTLLN